MENQYRHWVLLRMERAIKERMSSVDIDTVMPHDLINAKPAGSCGTGVLWFIPAFPVYGSDQPTVRDYA